MNGKLALIKKWEGINGHDLPIKIPSKEIKKHVTYNM